MHRKNAFIHISDCMVPVARLDIFSGGIAFLTKIELKFSMTSSTYFNMLAESPVCIKIETFGAQYRTPYNINNHINAKIIMFNEMRSTPPFDQLFFIFTNRL